MKKLFYLLFLLPPAFFAACNDDDDLPKVDLEVTLSGVTQVDNSFYSIVGDTITVNNVGVKSLTDHAATLTNVRFMFDGVPVVGPVFGSTEAEDYLFKINTKDFDTGRHLLGMVCTVLQVDKSISTAALTIPINMVENEEALPDGAPAIGTYKTVVRMDSKK